MLYTRCLHSIRHEHNMHEALNLQLTASAQQCGVHVSMSTHHYTQNG